MFVGSCERNGNIQYCYNLLLWNTFESGICPPISAQNIGSSNTLGDAISMSPIFGYNNWFSFSISSRFPDVVFQIFSCLIFFFLVFEFLHFVIRYRFEIAFDRMNYRNFTNNLIANKRCDKMQLKLIGLMWKSDRWCQIYTSRQKDGIFFLFADTYNIHFATAYVFAAISFFLI